MFEWRPLTQNVSRDSGQERRLVEMSWDPITRIVGSLGIYTKIDFANREVAECYSTSSIFRGYSIFMKNKDPRDAHFITSRICGIAATITRRARLTRRIWPSASGRPTWRSGLSIWARPRSTCSTTISSRTTWWGQFLRADGKRDESRCSEKAQHSDSPTPGFTAIAKSTDIMTALNPFTGDSIAKRCR